MISLLTWIQDAPTTGLPEIAVAICDRYTGVGADGWMLVDRAPGDGFDASLRLFNSDGSEPELSGNGTRCAAALLARTRQGQKRVSASVPVPGLSTSDFCLTKVAATNSR